MGDQQPREQGLVDQPAVQHRGTPDPVGAGPTAIAYGLGAVWVANSADRTLTRIDPSTGDVVKTVRTKAVGRGVAVGGGFVWVTDEANGALVQVDPALERGRRGVCPSGRGRPALCTARATYGSRTLSTHGRPNRSGDARPSPDDTLERKPVSARIREGSLWVATEFGQDLVRIDPLTSVLRETTPLGNRPVALAAGDGGVWVAVQSGGAGHRGGRLVVIAHPVDTIDPQLAAQVTSSNVATTVYDGLTPSGASAEARETNSFPTSPSRCPNQQTAVGRTRLASAGESAIPTVGASRRETFGGRRSVPSAWTASRPERSHELSLARRVARPAIAATFVAA